MHSVASGAGDEDASRRQIPLDGNASGAGVVDALCGGRAHFFSNRRVAERMSELSPLLVAGLRASRGFTNRAVVSLGNHGIRQFIDVGCGFPGARATHELAGRGRAGMRTVYADMDSSVVAFMDTMAEHGSNVASIHGDVRLPDSVLNDRRVRALMNLSQPVCLILGGILAHVSNRDDPAGVLAGWRERLAPGSWLVLSHPTTVEPGAEDDGARLAVEVFETLTGTPLVMRTPMEIGAMLTGWDVQAPGLAVVNAWRPALLRGQPVPMLGAIAAVPAPAAASAVGSAW
jgi:SAM-dependent methyltransferase